MAVHGDRVVHRRRGSSTETTAREGARAGGRLQQGHARGWGGRVRGGVGDEVVCDVVWIWRAKDRKSRRQHGPSQETI